MIFLAFLGSGILNFKIRIIYKIAIDDPAKMASGGGGEGVTIIHCVL